ncbi:MAG: hypothetical protein BGN95_20130 [Sphingomonas sp. 66-10]|nr:MAG: hypothetical protein BGN95_20130 [Sphingomonas sp. 66-10]
MRYPPLGDFYGHVGRYYVMIDDGQSDYLRRYFDFRWRIMGNLGQDLMMVPVGGLIGVERGARLLTALIAPLTILALRQLSIAATGAVQAPALLALPFVFSFPLLFGFINYALALAVALWGLVFWYRIRRCEPLARSIGLALIASIVWLCHLAGWATFVLGVGAIEASAAWVAWRGGRGFWRAVRPCLSSLSILTPISFTLASAGEAGETGNFDLALKLRWLAFVLRDQSIFLDLGSQLVIAVAVAFLIARRWVTIEPALTLAAAALFILFWLMPTQIMGSFFADLRLLPVVAIFALLGLRSIGAGRRSAIALLGVGLFLVRLAVMTIGWIATSDAIASDLKALDRVPRGSRIAVLAPMRMCENWPNDSVSHIASLAIGRREAFVNSQWNIAGQLMRPIYNWGRGYNDVVSATLAPAGTTCSGNDLAAWLRQFPRDRFDYVWLFRAGPLPAIDRAWLQEEYRGAKGVLHRITDHGLQRP